MVCRLAGPYEKLPRTLCRTHLSRDPVRAFQDCPFKRARSFALNWGVAHCDAAPVS